MGFVDEPRDRCQESGPTTERHKDRTLNNFLTSNMMGVRAGIVVCVTSFLLGKSYLC